MTSATVRARCPRCGEIDVPAAQVTIRSCAETVTSTYVPGRVYGCFFDDETGIANRDAIGITQMVFEVDYPHQDTTWPYTNKLVEKMAEQLTEYELERVLRRNALDMLGID